MIIYEPDDIEEAIASIPMDNLGDSGLIVHKYEEWKEGDPTKPNNVLISCIDRLSQLAIVGIDKETGEVYCASSSDEIDEVSSLLDYFQRLLSEYKELDEM